jgi:hypothetical protein
MSSRLVTLWLIFTLFLVVTTSCARNVHEKIEALADRACACTNAACAEQVVDELVQLSKQGGYGDQQRAYAASVRIGKCVREAGMNQDKFFDAMSKLEKK